MGQAQTLVITLLPLTHLDIIQYKKEQSEYWSFINAGSLNGYY